MLFGKPESSGGVRSIEHGVAVALEAVRADTRMGSSSSTTRTTSVPRGIALSAPGRQGKLEDVPAAAGRAGRWFPSHLTGDHNESRIPLKSGYCALYSRARGKAKCVSGHRCSSAVGILFLPESFGARFDI
jgi:hypothetical protein